MKQTNKSVACICLTAALAAGCPAPPLESPEPLQEKSLEDGGVAPTEVPPLTVPDSGSSLPLTPMPDAGLPPLPPQIDAGHAFAIPVDAGFTAPADAGFGTPESAFDAGTPHPDCGEPLWVTPQEVFTLPYQLTTFLCGGGSGACTFEIVPNEGASQINPITGAYLSGGAAPRTEQIRVVDPICDLEQHATVQIVLPLTLAPEAPRLPLGGVLFFEPSGGSGTISVSLIQNETGASVDEAIFKYQAGNAPGQDVLLATDALTGDSAILHVTVEEGFTLIANPKMLLLPVGQSAVLHMNGSGQYQTITEHSEIVTANAQITGLEAGTGELTLRDAFTTLEVTVPFQVLLPQEADLLKMGDRAMDSILERIPDVTGDDQEDLLLGLWYADVTGKNSGAVYLYASTPNGFETTPSQIFSGKARGDSFGDAIAHGDVNADGHLDLLIGAWGADEGLSNNGGAYLYLGAEHGFLSEPSRVYVGENNNDNLGTGVGICDVNGDDRADIILGAALAEDRNADPQRNSQGALYVYLGVAGGLPTERDQVIFGRAWEPESNAFVLQTEARLGNAIATGDVNGDGLCDVVAANWRYRTGGNNRQDGAVFAYRGIPPAGYSLGGLASEPSWGVIASSEDDDDREFARFLKVSDIDQDGRSDLLVGHWYDAPVDRQGSMKIFLGRDFNTTPEISSADQFDWRIQGESDFDYLGISGDVMDVNADGLPDVLVGASQGGERSIGTSNHRVGHVGVYLGQPNDVPEGVPHTQSHGEISGDWWGHGVTAFARPHPQGTVTGLVVFSSRKDKNEAAKLPHLALTELVAPTADPIDAGPPQPSTCEVVAQIETSVVYPTEQPTLAVQVSVPVFETTDAGNGGVIFDSGTSLDFRPLTQVRFASAGQPEIADPAAAWLDAVFTREADGSWVFTRDVPTPSFGQKILVARTLGPTGAWVYCDGDATDAVFSLDESPRQDVRLELNVPSEFGGSQFGQSAAFIPNFFGLDGHAMAVGANRAATGTQQSQSGTVKIYAQADGAFNRLSHLTLAEHQGHNGYDVFGSAMHSAGHFFDAQTPALAVVSEYDDLPRSNARSGWDVDANCPASNNRDNAGSLNIFQGGALTPQEQQSDAPRRDPAEIIFGPQASQRLQDVAGELDVNGDGLDDLIVTSKLLDSGDELNNICPDNNCGGYAIVLGHPANGSDVAVSCDSDNWVFGRENGAELGQSVAALGDLNNDGCDDFAVGAPMSDYGIANQGAVHVIFGNGGTGCPEVPLEIILVPSANGARFGYALDGRVDVTGDAIPDLLVGAPRGRDGEEVVGAAYLVSGAYLASLFPQATPANQPQTPGVFPLGDATHTFSRLLGHGSGNEFGYAVATVPGAGEDGAAAIAVGEPYSSSFGFDRTGAVWGYRYDTAQQAFSPIPIFGVAGESDRPDSRLGITVTATQLGGTIFLSVGGDLMSTDALDQGACFVWSFDDENLP